MDPASGPIEFDGEGISVPPFNIGQPSLPLNLTSVGKIRISNTFSQHPRLKSLQVMCSVVACGGEGC